MKTATLLLLITIITAIHTYAQGPWNGKKCAVVLTYDDALNVHLDNAIPLLDSLGMKATFYLSAFSPGCQNRLDDWRKAASRGHELGNHTLFHPCIGKIPAREWVSPERDLDSYSIPRILDEIRMTNIFLQSLDGKKVRTFAYPCGDSTVKGQSFIPHIRKDFVSARGVENKRTPISTGDHYKIGAYPVNGHSAEQLINAVNDAISDKTLLVFLFHGVGGEHGLNVGLKEHRKLLVYLKKHEAEVWVASFLEVTTYMKGLQK